MATAAVRKCAERFLTQLLLRPYMCTRSDSLNGGEHLSIQLAQGRGNVAQAYVTVQRALDATQ